MLTHSSRGPDVYKRQLEQGADVVGHRVALGFAVLGQDVYKRQGVLLYDGASGSWAEDGVIRRATLHVVGDRDDNISTSAKAAMRRRLVGFDPLTGTSAGGHKVYLTIDAELNAAALEALNGRKGAVAVYNYRTDDVLCMVSSPCLLYTSLPLRQVRRPLSHSVF